MANKTHLSFDEVNKKLESGSTDRFAREEWGGCRHIRNAVLADNDFINFDIDGLVVQDCYRPVCDCSIGIWRPEPQDKKTDDWFIVTDEK